MLPIAGAAVRILLNIIGFCLCIAFTLGSVALAVLRWRSGTWVDLAIAVVSALFFGVGVVIFLREWREKAELRRSVRKLLPAADGGDAQAQYCVACMLSELGQETMACRYFTAAAESGHADAMFYLGIALLPGIGASCREDEQEGIAWLRRADAAGSEDAAEWLAPIYEYGTRFTPADTEEACRWYRRAADLGGEDAAEKWSQLSQGRKEE